ncbi:ATPase, T2SS/T4P/T4SS family [Halobium salinum]|uniref:ATPase, T2SS/T4P/T4SS family n=1 Tax=Halobium salinum TaxID=1364940 RepID=A0ABD5PCP2_9EURY|nr:type II/IV secretion system ATPase subunit [Halobium salinum]
MPDAVRGTGSVNTAADPVGRVPPPAPPDSADAWYAPDVRAQYAVHPGVVATVRETTTGFAYEVREPSLGADHEAELERVREHFADVRRRRPLTREGTAERAAAGLQSKYRRALDRLVDATPAARRRLDYYALRDLRLLGELTPLALDDAIEVVDGDGGGPPRGPTTPGTDDDSEAGIGTNVGDGPSVDDGPSVVGDADRLLVHTADYAPAVTDYAADAEGVERVAGERLARYTVEFAGFGVDVVVYREHLLGNDRFATKYAVLEPDLLPGDRELVEVCKERVWETNVADVVDDRRAFVAEHARTFLSRQLTARNTRAWVDATAYRLRSALAEYDLAVPPVGSRYAADRLDDLVYYVLRDYVGEGILTVPIRDPHLEDVEANRVGERVKVVPRGEVVDRSGEEERRVSVPEGRVPTNLAFDDETTFVNVVTQLAASDGTELNASTPSAKVNLDPPGVDETVRCAVALPVISEGGPHVSIRKQSPEAMTPVDLVKRGSLSTELVALLWMVYEHHGVVLFSGPTGAGKTTLMNAHLPFVPFDDRPISIDEGSREVQLPHETAVSLTTRDHESEYKRVTMADLMTQTNYLNPDVEVIAEINTPESFRTFGETLNTGHGVVGTTHAEDVETLVNRVVEQGLPAYLLCELDLVVFPRHVDGERYVGEIVEFLSPEAYEEASGEHGVVQKGGTDVHWNRVAWRDTGGEFRLDYDHPDLGDDSRRCGLRTFHRIATLTDRAVADVEREFHRKHRYVEYLVDDDVSDVDDLFAFLAGLRTDEAATVERIAHRRAVAAEHSGGGPADATEASKTTAAVDAPDGSVAADGGGPS